VKILYLVSNPQLNPLLNTGYGRHIRETVQGLEMRGHKVKVMLSGNFGIEGAASNNIKPASNASKLKSFIPRIVWETSKDIVQLKSDFVYIKRVKEAVRSFKPDIVYERVGYLSRPIQLKRTCNIPWMLVFSFGLFCKKI
jgi:hypothetical protein